jgi:hypothetical protein
MRTILTLASLLLFQTFSFAQSNLNWMTLNSGTTKNINDIYFHSPDTGYIVGENYLFKKTTDGGLTWVDLPAPNIGEKPGNNGNIVGIDYHSPQFISSLDTVLILTWEKPYHGVFTTDEGANYLAYSFINQPENDSNQFCQVSGFSAIPNNKGNGYVKLITYGQNCNGTAFFSNFFDGFFSIIDTDSSKSYKSGSFTTVDSDSFSTIFGHSNGYLIKYDYILPQPDSIFLDSSGISSVVSAGNHIWYATTNRAFYNMYISVDTGKTFVVDSTLQPTFFYPNFTSLHFSSPESGLAGAESNGRGVIVVKDTNQWSFYYAPQKINKVKLFSDGTAYAFGDSGLVMKTSIITSIKNNQSQINTINIYPNPATNYLIIDGISHMNPKTIQLYDLKGTLLKAFNVSSNYLDLNGLPKGIFLLKIQTQDAQISKKVIIN